MNKCPNCNEVLPDGAEKCAVCGSVISQEFAQTARRPPSDGGENAPTRLQKTEGQKRLGVETSGNGGFVAGAVLAKRYRIIGLLGKGGMGEVYKAEDLELNQTVALKFLPETVAKDNRALARFRSEVRIARAVAHPNVCRVFDIGEIEGSYYLSMEFIDGDDLSSLLRRIGRLPSDKGVEIARQLCLGLHAIHGAGILHRDLKPANVIVDSRGKARITDFGIAGIEQEIQSKKEVVGTPAYMSPEQITGKEVTAKSDIYSLGLLLYEIFTGKQALRFDSIPELIRKHQTETATNPSEILKDIDPLVEKTILHCLEKNPADRPKNALQVALMLPGGNPLQFTLEAGETPSPEMVAAAPKKGALKPPVALALLACVIACFVFLVYFSYPVKQNRWLPLEKSPEVLLERAKSVAQKLGYTYSPADSAYGFNSYGFYSGYVRSKQKTEPPGSWVNSMDWRERLKTGQPEEILFWYRQSPSYFSRYGETEVDYFHPSATETSAMVRISLDVRGRLMEFTAVPPQIEADNLQRVSTDWAAVFTEAGLDIRNYKQAESKWTPWTYADERAAWEGGLVDHPDIPIRVEGAAYQGKPVYFKVVKPWEPPYRELGDLPIPSSIKIGRTIAVTAIICVLISGIFVARYNFKGGRADTRGAFKVLIFVFGASLLSSLLIEPHFSSSLFTTNFIRDSVAEALFAGFTTWIAYLAIEPFVRKHWAHLSVSWIRLMAGEWRDPLVGRDILIGGLFGLLHTTAIYLMNFQSKGLTFDSSPVFSGWRGIVGKFGDILADPIFLMSLMLLLVIILTTVFRRRWLAIAVLWFLHFSVLGFIFFGSATLRTLVGAAVIATIMTVPLMRFGMLAYAAYYIFFHLSHTFPLTTDVSAWYFNATVFAAVVILGLASCGFYTSTAGQSVFQAKFKEDKAFE